VVISQNIVIFLLVWSLGSARELTMDQDLCYFNAES
jgi:hypothetical protein